MHCWTISTSRGRTALDTAHAYRSEKALGQWIKLRGVREEMVILGKGTRDEAGTPEGITAQLLETLETMQVDYLDIYMMHSDRLATPVGELIDCLNEHLRTGRIRAFGGSDWSTERIDAANEYPRKHNLVGFAASSPNLSLAQWNEPMWPRCLSACDPLSKAWYAERQMPLFAWSGQATASLQGGIARKTGRRPGRSCAPGLPTTTGGGWSVAARWRAKGRDRGADRTGLCALPPVPGLRAGRPAVDRRTTRGIAGAGHRTIDGRNELAQSGELDMKQVAITGARQAMLVDKPELQPYANWAVVKVHAAPMCTEYKRFLSGEPTDELGHEAAGEVVAVAQPGRVKVGDRVVAMPLYGCGVCSLCVSGDYIHCENTQALGDGAKLSRGAPPTPSTSQTRLAAAQDSRWRFIPARRAGLLWLGAVLRRHAVDGRGCLHHDPDHGGRAGGAGRGGQRVLPRRTGDRSGISALSCRTRPADGRRSSAGPTRSGDP